MKKFLLTLATLLIFVGLEIPTFAQSNADPEIDLDLIKTDLVYSVIEAEKYEQIEIGNPMLAFVWDGTNLISSKEDVLFYPIYGDNKIVAILSYFNPYDSPSYSVGVDFAPELDAATNSGAQEYFIIEAGSQLYIYTKGEASLLSTYGQPMEVSVGEEALLNENVQQSNAPQPDEAPTDINDISINYESSNSLTLEELDSYIESNKDALLDELANSSDISSNHIDITPTNYVQPRAMHYLDTEILNQGNTEHCTFYAATIIGNYLTGKGSTPAEVMDWANDDFGNIFDAQNVLNNYYGLDYSYIYEIYGRDAYLFIEEGYPLYAAFYDEDNVKGHALAVTGYSDAGDYGIGVVETLTGSRKAIIPSAKSTYVTRAYSRDCYWKATLYYKYW